MVRSHIAIVSVFVHGEAFSLLLGRVLCPISPAVREQGGPHVLSYCYHLSPSSLTGTQPLSSLLALVLACVLMLAGGVLTCLIR